MTDRKTDDQEFASQTMHFIGETCLSIMDENLESPDRRGIHYTSVLIIAAIKDSHLIGSSTFYDENNRKSDIIKLLSMTTANLRGDDIGDVIVEERTLR